MKAFLPEGAAVLAQANRPSPPAAANTLWHTIGVALLLVVAAVVLVVLAFWLKRQLFGGPVPTAAEPAAGFTPSDLRRLRASGKMTEAEYERARAKLVEPHRRRIAEAAGDERESDVRTKDTDLIREAE